MVGRSIKYLVHEGFRSVWTNRLMSLASVCVLMSCLVIMGSMSMVFLNIESLLGKIEEQNVVMAFISDDASDDDIASIESSIKDMNNIKDYEFVPKETAWEQQLETMQDSQKEFFKEITTDIPLPDSYKITVKDMDQFDNTVQSIKSINKIDNVRENKDLAQKLVSIRQGITVVAIVIIAVLFAVSMFIISNTIKLTMYSRRLEINIMKSVGATDSFVKIPFVVEGMVLGMASGLISLLMVFGIYQFAVSQFGELLSSFGMKAVPFASVVWIMMAAFVLIGVLSGTLGSLVSMRKYLKKEGSEISAL